MSIKAIVRHDASQIWVANEEHAKKIIHLSLVPISSVVKTCDARYWRCLICVCLYTNSRVVTNTEQVVDNFKSLISGGEVDCSDVGDLCELCRGIV